MIPCKLLGYSWKCIQNHSKQGSVAKSKSVICITFSRNSVIRWCVEPEHVNMLTCFLVIYAAVNIDTAGILLMHVLINTWQQPCIEVYKTHHKLSRYAIRVHTLGLSNKKWASEITKRGIGQFFRLLPNHNSKTLLGGISQMSRLHTEPILCTEQYLMHIVSLPSGSEAVE